MNKYIVKNRPVVDTNISLTDRDYLSAMQQLQERLRSMRQRMIVRQMLHDLRFDSSIISAEIQSTALLLLQPGRSMNNFHEMTNK